MFVMNIIKDENVVILDETTIMGEMAFNAHLLILLHHFMQTTLRESGGNRRGFGLGGGEF